MGSANKEKALELANKVKRLYPEYEKLKVKVESEGKDLSEKEKERYDLLQEQLIKSVDETTKDAIKFVDAPTLVKIKSLVDAKAERRTVFTYQPKTSSSNLIVLTSTEIKSTVITGANKKFKGLPDDLMNFSYQPTLQILGRNELGQDNWKPIYHDTKGMSSEYTLTCSFKLNRFPERTWYKSVDSTYQSNTTRRTEIMRFQYADAIDIGEGKWSYQEFPENFISIGAVAPYENVRVNAKRGVFYYKNRFSEKSSPFSIGISLPLGDGAQCIYTDYKFELSKWYNLRMEMVRSGDYENTYEVSLYVNGVLENTSMVNFILWGRKSNNHRRFDIYENTSLMEDPIKWFSDNPSFLVASAPGFRHCSGDSTINEIISGTVSDFQKVNSYTGKFDERTDKHKSFNFNVLSKIVTPPYYTHQLTKNISLLDNPQYIRHKNTWNHHKQKMNSGIDYGDITISIK